MDGGFRWLTVGPKGQPDVEIVLYEAKHDGMALDEETAGLLRALLEKGGSTGFNGKPARCHAFGVSREAAKHPGGRPFAASRLRVTRFASRQSRESQKGKMGGGVLEADDCQKTYEELKSKGVHFIQPPQAQPYGYGVEALFTDGCGNWFSLTQHQ